MKLFGRIRLCGRYLVQEVIGKGSMGVVYKAYDEDLRRFVAIKTIESRFIDETFNKTVGDLHSEARITAQLSHPCITAIYDIGTHEDVEFFVMEYLEGDTLENIIKSGAQYSLLDKLNILSSLSKVVHYAHQRGVIHRDIKPENIMILSDGQLKIMDFGIAQLRGEESTRYVVGTPIYMSPEQLLNEELDLKTDIYSIGVVAYYFLTGSFPFDGKDFRELLDAVFTSTPDSVRTFSTTLPVELDTILLKALEKKPELRHINAGRLGDEFQLLVAKIEDTDTSTLRQAHEYSDTLRKLRDKYVFFSDFNDDEIVEIFKLASIEMYSAGNVIFREGAVGNKLYIVQKGRVHILKGDPEGSSVEVVALKQGDCFGEMAIIDSAPRSASAISIGESTLLGINEALLRTLQPQLCMKLYRNIASVIADNLRTMTDQFYQVKPGGK